MRRFFTVPSSRSVLVAGAFSRWQSGTATPEERAEESAKAEGEKDANASTKSEVTEAEKMQKTIAENKRLFEVMKKDILYTAADAENARREYRQAVDKEKRESEKAFAKELLQFTDALNSVCKGIAAYRAEKQDTPPNIVSLLNGVDLSFKVVLKVLGKYGVSRMETKLGDPFDPETMQSILTTPSTESIKAGQVSEIVKAGFFYRGKVLRPAQVGVAEDPEKK